MKFKVTVEVTIDKDMYFDEVGTVLTAENAKEEVALALIEANHSCVDVGLVFGAPEVNPIEG